MFLYLSDRILRAQSPQFHRYRAFRTAHGQLYGYVLLRLYRLYTAVRVHLPLFCGCRGLLSERSLRAFRYQKICLDYRGCLVPLFYRCFCWADLEDFYSEYCEVLLPEALRFYFAPRCFSAIYVLCLRLYSCRILCRSFLRRLYL